MENQTRVWNLFYHDASLLPAYCFNHKFTNVLTPASKFAGQGSF